MEMESTMGLVPQTPASRTLVCDIVNNDDAMRASVVRRGDRSESLLPCGVPLQWRIQFGCARSKERIASAHNLQLHSLPFQLNGPNLEINTDG